MNQDSKPPLWQTAHAEELPEDQLNAVLEFYEENLVLKTFGENTVTVKHLSPQEVARALANEVSLCSGLLTPDVLWWRHDPAGATTAVWRDPQTWNATLQEEPFKPPRRFELPMPGLLFIARPARAPLVFAAPERPTSVHQPLFHTPTYNVFANGRVCPGNHRFPTEPSKVPESFFQSFFSLTGDPVDRSRKHGSNILSLWEEINGQPLYPTGDLVECTKVSNAMERLQG